jgi:glutamate dehydrogenase (NAD(P)+)
VALLTRATCETLGIELKGARVVLQGFGNVGTYAAQLLDEAGAKIIAVGDASGSIVNENGIDIPALLEHHTQNGSVRGFSGVEPLRPGTLLETPCDILIPAALGGVIDSEVAARVSTRLVVEAANAPVTAGGAQVLLERGICTLPDLLANSGGVTVSYFEWTQNLTEFRWKEERVQAELEETLLAAYSAMTRAAAKYNTDWRTAAYTIAVDRVASATRLRWMG